MMIVKKEKNEIENKTKTVARIPMTLATAIVVMIALIPCFFFGNWRFTIWASFVVWAEYFALGATPGTIKIISPCLLAGSSNACIYIITSVFLQGLLSGWSGLNGPFILYIAWCISTLIWTPVLIIPLQKFKFIQKGSLPYFNGFAMVFAIFFTSSVPHIGPMNNVYWLIFICFVWANLMGLFGWVIGYLNIALTFPKVIKLVEKNIE